MKVKNNLKTLGIGIAILALVPVFASALSVNLGTDSGYYTDNSGYYTNDAVYSNPSGYYSNYSTDAYNPYGYDDSYGDIYGGGVGVGYYGQRGWVDARNWNDRGWGRRGGDDIHRDGSSHRLYHSGGIHGGRGHR